MKQRIQKISTSIKTLLTGRSQRHQKSAADAAHLAISRLKGSALLDPEWYLATYTDVAAAGMDPFEHFHLFGASEGRDPSPAFSTNGYRYAYSGAIGSDENPLLYFLDTGRQLGHEALPFIAGKVNALDGAPTVLVCAHQAGIQPFGAERSLLDVLSSLAGAGMNVLVTVPSAGSGDYIRELEERSAGVWIVPYRWWRHGRPPCRETVELFTAFIRQHRVALVLLNTVVLEEPGVAARECGVPVIVHVRELPEYDPDLCQLLDADANCIRDHVITLADRVIVNSKAVDRFISAPGKTAVIPDCFDPASDMPQQYDPRHPRIGLISSNLPKKGLLDFVELAGLLQGRLPHVQCLLIGPENEHVNALRQAAQKGELPPNLVFAGYAPSPREAMSMVDLVVNLSHVQESFGRTVLEAMAFGKPVVCYDWGGLSELVADGETGYLVPFGALAMATERVCEIFGNASLFYRFGEAGRKRAMERYNPAVFAQNMSLFIKTLL